MNGKIRKLAKLAGMSFVYEYDSSIVMDVEDLEKFAELIIKECAELVDHILKEGGGTQGDSIKEHFGVES